MKIYMGSEDQRGECPEYVEPGEIAVTTDDGRFLLGQMLLDKDGNPTEVFYDGVVLLAKCEEQEEFWYEVTMEDQLYERFPIH